jgi:aldehyde dehydrogenase (NAD+)
LLVLNEFYIDGAWVKCSGEQTVELINPADELPFAQLSLGSPDDVDAAAAAARRAFRSFGSTSRDERLSLLHQILAEFRVRYDEIAEAIRLEMGAPSWLSEKAQAATGVAHLEQAISVLSAYQFELKQGSTMIVKEPIGVCGLITPWNWPVNQIMCKLAPAIAAGCTIILKPSEFAPLSARLIAQVMHAAGIPPGVFNLINGDGDTVGNAIARHPQIDLVSFTGSTRAGILVAQAAANTVKRVHQELGGKSANVILPDADLDKAVKDGIRNCFLNSGQSCNAPTRMLVHRSQYEEVISKAKTIAESIKVGDPTDPQTVLGPVVNKAQYARIQRLIETGIEEGATLVAGGVGRPGGLNRGYYVKPTIFGHVEPHMTIAKEEIFGPVLVILKYDSEEEAIVLANDSPYGLAAYVQSGNPENAKRVAMQLRTGTVHLNGARPDFAAPFGGYKMSGNGREWGKFGFEEFLEAKAIMGVP